MVLAHMHVRDKGTMELDLCSAADNACTTQLCWKGRRRTQCKHSTVQLSLPRIPLQVGSATAGQALSAGNQSPGQPQVQVSWQHFCEGLHLHADYAQQHIA